MPRPSGIPLDLGRRNDDWPAGTGTGDECRNGHRRALVGQLLQSSGVQTIRLRHLRPVRRRLHDGRDLQRGRFAGRTPQARQPLLDLRQQPYHHRGQYGAGVQRRRGHALHRAWLEREFTTFKSTSDRPTLIIVDSHIAYGAPNKQDTSAAHGEPLGEEEIRLAKRHYGWPPDAKFLVPDEVLAHFQEGIGARGLALHRAWWAEFEEYRRQYPELADQGYRMLRRELPDGWDGGWPAFSAGKAVATRDAS